MTRGIDGAAERPTYETLVAQICHAEKGKGISFRDFQRKLAELKPGTNIRIYRLDQGDILRGRAAVLDVEVKSVDAQHSRFVCDGQYISSDSEEEPLRITSAVCTVPITSDIIMVRGEGIGRHNLMLVKKQEEPVLIFIQTPEDEASTRERGGLKDRIIERLRKLGIDIG